jgi:GNAT superfamily N-acetyltransferase
MCGGWRRLPEFSIRTFRTEDMGLITARQSILYAETQGWGRLLEANIGQTTADDFPCRYQPGREQCWVAELDGSMSGSIFLTDEGGGLARLRLLYVEPDTQGRGIGKR